MNVIQSKIISNIVGMFPDINESKVVSRKELAKFLEQYGLTWSSVNFLTKTKVGRGLYPLPDSEHNIKQELTPIIEQPTNMSIENVVAIQHKSAKSAKSAIPEHSVSSMIPEVDKKYIPFGVYKDMDKLIKSDIFAPVYITGHSGTGKNVMIEQLCAKHKRPMIRVNFHAQLTEDDLIGSKTLVDGNIEIVEGPVLIALRMGCILVLDEVDSGNSNLFVLQSILEGKPYYFRLKNEMIHPAPGFNIIAMGNTLGKGDDSGRYMGTNILNEAFLERFSMAFHQTYPTQDIEKKIVLRLMKSLNCENIEFAESLTKWSDAIRRTFEAGGIDEVISTRRITHIVKTYAIFGNVRKAIELGCNRFDELTRTAFIELFDKIATQEVFDKISIQFPEKVQADDNLPW